MKTNRTSPTRKSSRTTSSRTRSSSKKRSKKKPSLLAILVAAGIVITGYALDIIPSDDSSTDVDNGTAVTEQVDNLSDIPEYSEDPYVVLNGGKPYFSTDNLSTKSYEEYSELDSLGRCGVCEACIGEDLMPDDERGSIGQVKPTGWHTVKYDCVDGKYLYNRCHLIGWQLTGENANKCNLITGTRYMNVDGMLPFENMVADYIKETGNHVQYRVTPIFEGDNLLASGVVMEAYSIEDNGTDICFNVYVYNVQPEIAIDYETGESYYVGN
jgi:DNA-entry nuclease